MRSEGAPLTDLGSLRWVGDIPRRWATVHPDRPALIVPEAARSTTWAQLDGMSECFVETMTELGLVEGDRVAYLGRNSDLLFVALFGSIGGGLVLQPLNWRCAAPELSYMLSDARPRVVIVDAEFEPVLALAIDGMAGPSPVVLRTEGGGSLRALVTETSPSVRSLIRRDPNQVCLLLYTSGTTGRPKGVMATHGALTYARHAELVSDDWRGWADDDVVLSALPNFHVGGLSWLLIGLVRGLTCVVTADASAANILRVAREYGATRTFIVPTVIRAVLDHLTATGEPAPGFRTITYGAAVMTEPLLREAMTVLGCQFGQYFGMTEVTGTLTFLPPRDHDLDRPQLLRSVGRPQSGMAVEIRDGDGAVLPPGQAGEIWARTPTCMVGYWGLPEASQAVIVDGWYRTGDGGKLDAEGYLYLTDRIRDMIISGGENIYPAEVEAAIRLHPSVQDVAVVGVPDDVWGERVIAVVEWAHDQAPASQDQLIAFTRLHLAAYKCPKTVITTIALPRTAMGKVQRALVRAEPSV